MSRLKTSTSFIASFLVLLSSAAFAQFRGMAGVNAQMNRDFLRTQMDLQMQINMMRPWNAASQGKMYTVTMKDSSIKKFRTFIFTDSVKHKDFLAFEDKHFKKSDSAHRYVKIYADQTLYVSVWPDYDSDTEVYGEGKDTCWRFKPLDGAITVYTKWHTLYDDEPFDSKHILQLKKNEADPVKFDLNTLESMLKGDDEALQKFNKKQYYKAIEIYNKNDRRHKHHTAG